jgi:hypothetical protein
MQVAVGFHHPLLLKVSIVRPFNCYFSSINNCVLHRECQKDDWRNHKRHCGKEKVSKRLKGTVNDPFWKYPDVSDSLRHVPINKNDTISINSMGLPPPEPPYPYSQALQRQIGLITSDKDADYFLFDEVQRPIRFALPEGYIKLAFRTMRSNALSTCEKKGVQAIGEYLLKTMSDHPGLSRERILGQLSSEYGEETAGKIADFEKMAVRNGYEPGATFLEKVSRGLTSAVPRKMNGL